MMNLTLSQIAELVHGQLCGDAQLKIRGAETLPAARAGDLTLVDDPKLAEEWFDVGVRHGAAFCKITA